METERGIQQALISGIVSMVIGVLVTFLVSLIWPTPWTLGQAMLAVGAASLAGGFFSAYFAFR